MRKYLTNRGLKPYAQIHNNECPDALQKYFRKSNVKFQLVHPPLISIVAT